MDLISWLAEVYIAQMVEPRGGDQLVEVKSATERALYVGFQCIM